MKLVLCFLLLCCIISIAKSSKNVIKDKKKENFTKAMIEKLENPSEPNFVQLTMKQGLLMNQVLAFYALDQAENELCRNHTKEFKDALRRFLPWALKMFDASSKLQPGILLGNLIDYGSFTQCLNIQEETKSGEIFGKHCLIQIKPSIELIEKVLFISNIPHQKFKKLSLMVENSEIRWSVCVPHSCPKDDILRHFKKTFGEISIGLNLTFDLDENYCNTALNYPVMGRSQYILLFLVVAFLLLGILTGFIDFKREESTSVFIDIFSSYRNINKIFDFGGAKSEIEFIHGLKTISAFFVVFGHRYIMYIVFPVINQLEELNWVTRYSSLPVLGSTVSVDSFFFISAMLTSMGFYRYVKKTKRFNLFSFYLYRYLRITTPLALVILFYVTLPQYLGSGPYLYDVYKQHQKSCEDYWWSTLLHIQSFTNPRNLCIYQIWYLSCEMPFYFLSPIILYPIWKWPKVGYSILVILYAISLWANFYLAWINKYDGQLIPPTNQLFQTKYFSEYYIVPYTRASPYILGLAFGHLIIVNENKKIKINNLVNALIWICASIILGVSMLGCHVFFLETHPYNRLEATSYLAFSRSGWTLGLAWVIWACMHGYGGLVNEFLSAYIFKIISRISYGIFLLHSIIQLYKNGSAKAPMTFSNFNAVYDGFADLFTVFLVALMFTVFFEMPLVKLENIIFGVSKGRPATRKVSPKN